MNTDNTKTIPDTPAVCTGACKCQGCDIINKFIDGLEYQADDWLEDAGGVLLFALMGGYDKKHIKAALAKYHPDKGGDSRLFNVVMAHKNAHKGVVKNGW